jgi:hypothetical protein
MRTKSTGIRLSLLQLSREQNNVLTTGIPYFTLLIGSRKTQMHKCKHSETRISNTILYFCGGRKERYSETTK